MVKAIRVNEVGGPEVLKWEDIEIGDPKDGEIRVRNKAIGVDFIDVNYRKGAYKTATPFTPGMEAAGVVIAAGPGLTDLQVGDVVAYALRPMGSYAEEQILPADRVVPVPSSIDPSVNQLMSKQVICWYWSAEKVFADIANGVLRVRVNHKYPLSQAAQAHLDLESRKTTGSIVLIPDGVES